MKYLSNAFSLNMINVESFSHVRVKRIEPSSIPEDATSAIGHADTANVVSTILGRKVPANRTNVLLTEEDTLYVAQYRGPRLPEGATTLPEGATIEFLEVTVLPETCRGCPAVDCTHCKAMDWLHGF